MSTQQDRLPRLIAFDLDYTLWDLCPPVKRKGSTINEIVDRAGQSVSFYRDVPGILWQLKQRTDVTVAACSRTHAPDVARSMLSQFLLSTPGGTTETMPAIKMLDELEIYPGSKLAHFKQLHERTGIPYSEMLFFDDEARNREVERLGVTFVLVSSEGTTRRLFDDGVKKWLARVSV